MKKLLLSLCLLHAGVIYSQSYTSYFTGNTTDSQNNPLGGVCLMGGASEDDEAMKWFLQRANGGDILVFRASGTNGYNNYMYSQLGVNINSVETIVFHDASASSDPAIHEKKKKAEAIWFAGGNQWTYISYWRNTAIDSLINIGIKNRNLAVGGTSAGMAILGGFYFTAQNNTITSAAALSNPYDSKATIDSAKFIQAAQMQNVITDTHYDNPDRKGRHVAFLARILKDYGIGARGIACDEYTAVCIAPDGIAKVYGGFPSHEDNAYFIQPNCELNDVQPENCSPNTKLMWNHGGKALKVYRIKGTSTGANTFDLNDWKTGVGGTWEHWYVNDGVFNESTGTAIDCASIPNSIEKHKQELLAYPNPNTGKLYIKLSGVEIQEMEVQTLDGKIIPVQINDKGFVTVLNIQELKQGLYILKIQTAAETIYQRIIKQ
jgi:cyanophycinase-like exopeptidase